MSEKNKIIIQCTGLQVNAHQKELISDLNWEIRENDFWAITGPNGCGKTVLSTLLSGKRMQVKGMINYFFPETLTHVSELPLHNNNNQLQSYETGSSKADKSVKRSLDFDNSLSYTASIAADRSLTWPDALVAARSSSTRPGRPSDRIAEVSFDASTLFRGFHEMYYQRRYNQSEEADLPTIGEFIQLKLKGYELIEIQIFNLKLSQFFSPELLNRKINQLSNGESKKLLIMLSFIKNPYLIILDQAFTGLDEENRTLVYKLLSALRNQGIKIILICRSEEMPDSVTHILEIKDGKTQSYSRLEYLQQQLEKSILLKRQQSKQPNSQEQQQSEKPSSQEQQQLEKPSSPLQIDSRLINPPALDFEHFTMVEDFTLAVVMKNVHIAYGTVQILKNINWEIKKGERWVLTGPNGSGKSTLLSLINGDHPQAYAQNLVLFDRERGSGESIWDIKKKIGFLSPEIQIFFPQDQSTLKTILSGLSDTMGLFRKASPEEIATADQLMQRLQISNLREIVFRQLSTGEKRLVLLARSLIKNPPLLILDEPCQGLDDSHRHQFIRLVDEICSEAGKTLIYVSHYREDFPACAKLEFSLPEGKVNSLLQNL